MSNWSRHHLRCVQQPSLKTQDTNRFCLLGFFPPLFCVLLELFVSKFSSIQDLISFRRKGNVYSHQQIVTCQINRNFCCSDFTLVLFYTQHKHSHTHTHTHTTQTHTLLLCIVLKLHNFKSQIVFGSNKLPNNLIPYHKCLVKSTLRKVKEGCDVW